VLAAGRRASFCVYRCPLKKTNGELNTIFRPLTAVDSGFESHIRLLKRGSLAVDSRCVGIQAFPHPQSLTSIADLLYSNHAIVVEVLR
jgi:hypothetical protein